MNYNRTNLDKEYKTASQKLILLNEMIQVSDPTPFQIVIQIYPLVHKEHRHRKEEQYGFLD